MLINFDTFKILFESHDLFNLVGDPPKLLSGVTDVTVISPEVATLECGVKQGTQDAEVRWYRVFWSNRRYFF